MSRHWSAVVVAPDALDLELDAELRSIDEMAGWAMGPYIASAFVLVGATVAVVGSFAVTSSFDRTGADVQLAALALLPAGLALLTTGIALHAISGTRRGLNERRRRERVASSVTLAPLEGGVLVGMAGSF